MGQATKLGITNVNAVEKDLEAVFIILLHANLVQDYYAVII